MSWSLFKRMAFKQGRELENQTMVAVGKDILRKCVGVPLAIRTLGRLLYLKDSEKEWLSFRDIERSNINQDENDILPILRLSYNHLPSYLKQCFAYCCLFPKDYLLDKQTLIRLWMAQGFIQLSSGNQELEDVGDDYFKELLWRSFFQDVVEDKWDNATCKMHDLMHDLAKSVAEDECLLTDLSAKEIGETAVRHVSFDSPIYASWDIPTPLFKARKIRTFLLPTQEDLRKYDVQTHTHNALVSRFRRLRVLDQHGLIIETLSSSIGKLKHLRYLDFSWNFSVKILPNSICKLQNLETLNLSHCRHLEELPRDIGELVKLRHLDIIGCNMLTRMPQGLGQLTSLQTLPRFILSKKSSTSIQSARMGELGALNNLRGKLWIENLGGTNNSNELESKHVPYLKAKRLIYSLSLEWAPDVANRMDQESVEALLESLQPHENLEEFAIENYWGGKLPSWMRGDVLSLSLPNLVKILLFGCGQLQHLPELDQLPYLKSLSLSSLTALEYLQDNKKTKKVSSSTAGDKALFFPSLELLCLDDLPNLKGWWREEDANAVMADADQSFPKLTKLWINKCPMLTSMPLQPFLEKLRLGGDSATLLQQWLTPKEANLSFSGPSSFPLSKLKSLRISYVDGLVSVSEWIRHHATLRTLKFIGCYEFMVVPEWIGNLTSLQRLVFRECPKLASLPQGIRCLTSLQKLLVQECPNLKERCQKETGEDWPNIAHIPNITIEYKVIQGSYVY